MASCLSNIIPLRFQHSSSSSSSSSLHADSIAFLSPPLKPSSSSPLSLSSLSLRSTRLFSPVKLTCRARMAAESSNKTVEVFESKEDLAGQLAKYTADLSAKFANQRSSFTVVLSGGSLIDYLRKLTEAPYVDTVEWSKWHVFWVDERVVPKDHEDSNYKLAYDGFLSKVPIPTGNVYAINDALSAEGAADDYETCLRHLVKTGVVDFSEATGFPKFDLMLLGMGPDGHVASLFPGHPLVDESKKWVASIEDSPKPPPRRITYTFPVINSSAYVALVVTGAGKAGAVQKALGKGGEEDSGTLPVELVSPAGELTWFLDKSAASKL